MFTHMCNAILERLTFFPYELREVLFGLGLRPTHRALFTIQEEVVTVLAIRHVAQDRLTPDDVALPADEK